MIAQANIIEWRLQAPWAIDAQVEQDLILSRAIIEIFSDPFLSSELAFRGGTALHKLFLKPPSRYSEDIDLVQINSGGVGKVLEALRSKLDPWLGKPRWHQSEITATLIYRFDSEIPPVTRMRLKVEINTREHFSVLGFEKSHFAIENPWFTGQTDVTTFQLEELLGSKLRALYQRKKGRDLFDLDCAIKAVPDLNVQKVATCFNKYISFVGTKISKADFERNFMSKLSDEAFLNDIFPLLSRETNYDVLNAGNKVFKQLIEKINLD